MENLVPDDEDLALVDLTRVSLTQLSSMDNSAFSRSLRRVLKEADNPSEAIAGFQSSVAVWD